MSFPEFSQINARKLMEMKQKLLNSQEKINEIKNRCYKNDYFLPNPAKVQANDMIFSNLRDSFMPFHQPCNENPRISQ